MTRLYLTLGLAGAILAGHTAAYVVGRGHGYEKGRVEQMRDSIEAYRQRQEIDHAVDGMDDYGVCVELGGLPDECEQLRGVDASAGGE